jgi:hypothetical protein
VLEQWCEEFQGLVFDGVESGEETVVVVQFDDADVGVRLGVESGGSDRHDVVTISVED